ncbi:C45 family autoproteolytic acyltransferase/hydolase [Amycolatopsis jejuensis]|uniref:C45 family autoproteolytic acyltransferase/hydolase n=1 Tax=Amycolatopsis jejuensis TaxID=330084 RepID=UPI000524CB2E|nr:C45 family peptidase [Amycolatopsis jejuensis]
MNPFPKITVDGTPYQRGLSYGRQAAGLIATSLDLFLTPWLARPRALAAKAAPIRDLIGEHSPALLDEMQGTADGAGLELDQVVALNARMEFAATGDGDGCTAVALPGAACLGQNWDVVPAVAGVAMLLEIRDDDGPDLITLVEAGMLCRFGLNSAGLGLCGNYLQTEHDFEQPGVPVPVLRREILRRSTVEEAVEVVQRAPRSMSSNYLIAHRSGEAVDLESTPREVTRIDPAGGRIVHANHFLGRRTESVEDRSLARYPDSAARVKRAQSILSEPARPLGEDDLVRVFTDTDGHPYSIQRTATGTGSQGAMETIASLVMNLGEGVLRLARGPRIGAYHDIPLATAVPGGGA